MRNTELLDSENRKLTVDDLYTLLEEVFEDGQIHVDFGKCDQYPDETLFVVQTWEDLYQLNAIVNGWEGEGGMQVPYKKEELDSIIEKLQNDLNVLIEEDKYHGSIYRTRRDLEGYSNYRDYRKWLDDNNYDEVSLEDFGVDVVFSDEYSPCYCSNNGCQNIVRTSPDSYCWTAPYFTEDGCCPVCSECVASGEFDEEVLEDYCNVQKGIPDQFSLEKLGLVKINDDSFQNGWFKGMDDSPDKIIEVFHKLHNIDVYFKVHPSQFYVEFDVLVKKENEEEAKVVLSYTDPYQGYSSVERLESALKDASVKMAELKGDGIKYASCNSDGTADARLVSGEEFIDGIKG